MRDVSTMRKGVQYSHYTGTQRMNILSYARLLKSAKEEGLSDEEFKERYDMTWEEMCDKIASNVSDLTNIQFHLDRINDMK